MVRSWEGILMIKRVGTESHIQSSKQPLNNVLKLPRWHWQDEAQSSQELVKDADFLSPSPTLPRLMSHRWALLQILARAYVKRQASTKGSRKGVSWGSRELPSSKTGLSLCEQFTRRSLGVFIIPAFGTKDHTRDDYRNVSMPAGRELLSTVPFSNYKACYMIRKLPQNWFESKRSCAIWHPTQLRLFS